MIITAAYVYGVVSIGNQGNIFFFALTAWVDYILIKTWRGKGEHVEK